MTEGITVRRMVGSDSQWLETFLYLAVHIPPGQKPYPRSIIHEPLIENYIKRFRSAG